MITSRTQTPPMPRYCACLVLRRPLGRLQDVQPVKALLACGGVTRTCHLLPWVPGRPSTEPGKVARKGTRRYKQGNSGWVAKIPRSRRGSAWLGAVAMFHSDDDMSLLVPLFDVAVSLDNLLQRITPVNDRSYLSRLNKFLEED
jgi:hypothetical protein